MPKTVVLGNGPIAFTEQGGQMLLIPLTVLTLDGNTIQANPPYNTNEILQWLQYLVNTGFLTAGSAPAPKPAMSIQAVDPGPAGNNIQVVFSNIVPDPADPTNADKTTFDATITETDTYNGLSFDTASPSFIQKVLGTETITGTMSGLVHIKDADTPSLPKAGNYPLTGGDPSTKSSVPILGVPSDNAFHMEAKKVGLDGDNTKVTIANVDSSAKTFTLIAVWTQTVAGIKRGSLQGELQGNQYEIKVDKPAGGDFAIPAPGSIGLSGGADARPALNASAIAPAS
jgi:hypothetical protein